MGQKDVPTELFSGFGQIWWPIALGGGVCVLHPSDILLEQIRSRDGGREGGRGGGGGVVRDGNSGGGGGEF